MEVWLAWGRSRKPPGGFPVTMQRERVVHPLNVVFGDEIRARRQEAGLSQVKLGEKLGCTGQWIAQVEKGDKDPSREFALDLDTYFTTGGTFIRMAKEIKKLGRRLIHMPGFSAYLEIESQAKIVRAFAPQAVPGLLQNEGYASSLIAKGAGPATSTIEELVAHRMDRQSIFTRANPAKGMFALDEAVLHRTVGTPEIMRDQLTRLEELADTRLIQVRILPFSSVVPSGMDGAFTLLSLANDEEFVYLEAPSVSHLIDAPDNVAACKVRFDQVMAEALPCADSIRMIRRVREAL